MNKQFKALYYSSAISNLADGMNIALLPLLASGITKNPEEIALIAMTRTLPWFLLSLHSGNIIDNNPKKMILLIANTIRVLTFSILCILIATQTYNIIPLCILSFIIGSCEVFVDNTTSCLIPKVSTVDKLMEANGKFVSMEILLNKFIGVTIGAYAFSLLGSITVSLIILSLYLLASTGFKFLQINENQTSKNTKTSFLDGAFLGVKVIFQNKTLKNFMICSAIGNAVYAAFEGILVLYIIDIIQAPKIFYGTAIGALGIGSFIGGHQAVRLFSKIGAKNTYLISTALFPLFFGMIPFFNNISALIICLLALGFFFTSTVIITRTFRQRAAKDDLGKVNGVYRLVSWGTQPIAAIAGGILAKKYGIINTYYILAGLSSFVFIYGLNLNSKELNVK